VPSSLTPQRGTPIFQLMSQRSVAAAMMMCLGLGCGCSRADSTSASVPASQASQSQAPQAAPVQAPQAAPASQSQAQTQPEQAAVFARPGRVIVLGFDGVDPRWITKWVEQGKLPTLKRLIDTHAGRSFSPLQSTNPPQSPVAWTSFATGTLPGDHGIFDFIARTQNSSAWGLPILLQVSTTQFEVQPNGPPVARNLRTGTPFWQLLGNQGVRVVALSVPYSFPPDPMRDGRMLSGLGVPDARETNSTFTYVGTDVTPTAHAHPPGGGVMVPLRMEHDAGQFDLEGPTYAKGSSTARMKIPVRVRAVPAHQAKKSVPSMEITIGGTTYALPLRTWSDFIDVEFVHGPTRVRGILRVLPLELGARTRLFITPISLDPRAPFTAISHPRVYSAQLVEALGRVYKTVGWDHDTSALNAEVIDEEAFLQDVQATERDRLDQLMTELTRGEFDLLLWVSTAPDRVSHMFYRLMDPKHPRYDAALAKRYGDAILHEYQRVDATVASVLPQLRPEDTLILLSDHGFHSYRRGLHVNQWLRSHGLLALKGAVASADREFLVDVDWSKTKAYAVGTGQIYFNLRGREREGIVSASEVPALVDSIRTGLLALRDQQRGNAVVVRNVYVGAEVFRGKRQSDAPDLQIAFAENYRTSWETILGGVPKALFADNDKKWSGDHAASDAAETPGFVLSNRVISRSDPHIVDLAPTVLSLFQKPVPTYYAGHSLFE